jgi:hypothetical protein
MKKAEKVSRKSVGIAGAHIKILTHDLAKKKNCRHLVRNTEILGFVLRPSSEFEIIKNTFRKLNGLSFAAKGRHLTCCISYKELISIVSLIRQPTLQNTSDQISP